MIIERTMEIYGSPVNLLGISEDTKLSGKGGEELSINGFQRGNAVKVTLKDALRKKHHIIIRQYMR